MQHTTQPMTQDVDYAQLDYSKWTFLQRLFQGLVRLLAWLLMRIDAEGAEKIPERGAFILSPNHLHLLDVPVIFIFVRRRTVVFVADKWKNTPVVGWILGKLGDGIFVARGTPDRRALSQALQVLQAGGALALAPEGTRSRTGGLGTGHTGVAYLATRAPAPVLPVVAYGQEKCFAYWRRLRRVPIKVRFGDVIHLPAGKARTTELEKQTEEIMLALARLLPPEYQGIYASKLIHE